MNLKRWIGAITFSVAVLSLLAGCGAKTVRVDPLIPTMNIQELTQEAGAVVVGRVDRKVGVVRLKAPNEKTDQIYTDYAFTVEDGLKGVYKAGDQITLRLTGGQDGNLTTLVPDEYRFAGGERTLLFLTTAKGPENQAYVLTAQQGIFDIDAGGTVKGRVGHLGARSLSDLKSEILRHSKK